MDWLDDLFDLNGDGRMDAGELALEYTVFSELMDETDSDGSYTYEDETDGNSAYEDDFGADSDDFFDYEE